MKEITRPNKGNNFVLSPFQQRSVDVPKKKCVEDHTKPIPTVEPPHLVVERTVELHTEHALAEWEVVGEPEHQDLVVREEHHLPRRQILRERGPDRHPRDDMTYFGARRRDEYMLTVISSGEISVPGSGWRRGRR